MILWESFPLDPQPIEHYRALIERGLTQPIRMHTNMIAVAMALQKAGSPIIMVEGAAGNWPASLAPRWQHEFEDGFRPDERVRACLAVRDGWAIQARNVREPLQAFRDAGITVHGVWMDWEGDPWSMWMQFEQARHCTRCRTHLPRWALASPESCSAYSTAIIYGCWTLILPLRFLKCFHERWLLTGWSCSDP